MANYDDFDFDAEAKGGGRRQLSFVSALTILLVIAAIAVALMVVYVLTNEDNAIAERLGLGGDEPLPTLASTLAPLPSPTETQEVVADAEIESEVVLPPTHTPVPALDTDTPAPVNTLRPTLTPSVTPTFPPPTPSRTPTPTPTDTATPGPPPTVTATFSAYPFTKDLRSPDPLQNWANTAGCNWMGVAGEVFDLDGNPVPPGQYVVHVWDSGIDKRVGVGDAPAYGPSGYEQFLYDLPRVQEHNIQLETINRTAVSQVYRFQTRANCRENLIWFTFIQNH